MKKNKSDDTAKDDRKRKIEDATDEIVLVVPKYAKDLKNRSCTKEIEEVLNNS